MVLGERRVHCSTLSHSADLVLLLAKSAGSQGYFHHLKLDRLFSSILNNPAPLILYAEGGGGRPGDTDVHANSIKIGGKC